MRCPYQDALVSVPAHAHRLPDSRYARCCMQDFTGFTVTTGNDRRLNCDVVLRNICVVQHCRSARLAHLVDVYLVALNSLSATLLPVGLCSTNLGHRLLGRLLFCFWCHGYNICLVMQRGLQGVTKASKLSVHTLVSAPSMPLLLLLSNNLTKACAMLYDIQNIRISD